MFYSYYGYGIVNQKGSVLVFGGYCDGERINSIRRYSFDEWTYIGTLQNNRGFSRGIFNAGKLFIIGGRYSM